MKSRMKILIVEDSTNDAELIKFEIKKSSIQFDDLIVETEQEYRNALSDFHPDIILSDYGLPDFSGLKALQIKQGISPDIPFILVTGSLNDETAVEIMKQGADDYILKEQLARIGNAILVASKNHALIVSQKEVQKLLNIFSSAMEQNPASIVITDIRGNIEYVNPKFTQLTGYTYAEALGQNPRILKSGQTSGEEYTQLWQTITEGKVWEGEFKNQKKNGEFYYESARISPIYDEDGKITHFIATKEDITQRKKDEKKIVLLREAIEQSPNSIIITDPDGNIEFVNRRFSQIVQYTLDEVKGKKPRIFNEGHLPQVDYKDMWNKLKANKIWIGEHLNRKKDQSLFWENVLVAPMRDENGTISNYVLVNEDITDKRLMIQNLIAAKEFSEASERRYRSLFENMIEGFAYCKMIFENELPVDFVYLEVNKAFEVLSGLSGVTGRKVTDVIPGIYETDKKLFEIYGRVSLTGESESFEIFMESLQDWYSISVYCPEKLYFVAVFDVITQRKKAEIDLLQAKDKAEEGDRLKTAFLHNISHEIRTPLNAIIGFSSLLGNPSLNIVKRDEFIKIIIASSDQLLAIISGIIALASLDAGQEKLNKKSININEVLHTVFEQFQVNHINKHVKFEYLCSLPDRQAIVMSDPVKLMQILVNLVENALKFTEHGHVIFGYRIIPGNIQFFVEDSGIGIPEEMQQAIFERFRQVDNSATRKFGGTGLGLAISKGYVELLGGQITISSVVGKGSIFQFLIPWEPEISTTGIADSSDNENVNEIPTNRRILIVEDDFNNFLLLQNLLSAQNTQLLHAENGEVAVDFCRMEDKPHLILMDIQMPVMDGYVAVRIIKQLFADIPVIAVTAHVSDHDRKRIMEEGFDDFIAKPINKSLLFMVLSKWLQ